MRATNEIMISMFIAYVGPGLGAGALLVVIGVVALIVLTLITFLWFPIKRLFKKNRDDR